MPFHLSKHVAAVGLATALSAVSVEAQTIHAEGTVDLDRGCPGFHYRARVNLETGVASAHWVVVEVPRGAPGERAGVQVGDSLIAVDGKDTMVNPPGQVWVGPPGTSYALTIWRAGALRELTLVSGRRDPKAPLEERGRTCLPST